MPMLDFRAEKILSVARKIRHIDYVHIRAVMGCHEGRQVAWNQNLILLL